MITCYSWGTLYPLAAIYRSTCN